MGVVLSWCTCCGAVLIVGFKVFWDMTPCNLWKVINLWADLAELISGL